MIWLRHFLVVLFIALLADPSWAASEKGARPSFARDKLVITKADGHEVAFKVEVARTSAQQEYGLMFQKYLSDDEGMLFVYDQPKVVYFWMKNTLIPLDMIFVGSDTRIVKIIANAQPMDETPVGDSKPILAVMEVPAGDVARLGIKIGDKVACWSIKEPKKEK